MTIRINSEWQRETPSVDIETKDETTIQVFTAEDITCSTENIIIITHIYLIKMQNKMFMCRIFILAELVASTSHVNIETGTFSAVEKKLILQYSLVTCSATELFFRTLYKNKRVLRKKWMSHLSRNLRTICMEIKVTAIALENKFI